ncbi:PD40 domain-containing protein [Candidatus Poribacteria bacterium]|nr:PD40 domain-containing protein [Candidatus Poribacteria bacterium]
MSVLAKAPTTPKILFTSERDGNREVYMMNPDGSEQVNLTQHPADDQRALWSPTGEQVLFLSDRGGVRDLYLMNPAPRHCCLRYRQMETKFFIHKKLMSRNISSKLM